MKIFDLSITVLVTIAALFQGTDAALNLVDRWRKRRTRDRKSAGTDEPSRTLPRVSFRLTRKRVDRLMFLIPWYLLLVAQIMPLYQYLSFIPYSLDRILTMMAYSFLWLAYPFFTWKTPHRTKLLLLIVFFMLIDFTLAGLSFYVSAFREAGWYTRIISIGHAISFTGSKYLYMFYFILEYFKPWFESLPEE